ncbi:MAG: SRPBCC family protein [Gordonia sp. (in: high G+C Gram-positive bacteria)]
MTSSLPAVSQPSVSDELVVAADPAAVYTLITDLDVLAELADETVSMRWTKGGDPARPGSVFKGRNKNGGKSWTTTCTVTCAQPGVAFEFAVKSFGIPISRWRYDIEAVDGGCRVTESTWDDRFRWFLPVAGLATGVKDRTVANAEHIAATLQRLKARAEQS